MENGPKRIARFDNLISGAAKEDHLMVEVIKEDNHKIIAMAQEIIRLREEVQKLNESNDLLKEKLYECLDEMPWEAQFS